MPDDPAAGHLWWTIPIIVCLLLLYMLIAFGETAIVSMGDARLAKLADEENKKAKRVLSLTERSRRFSETVRLCKALFAAAYTAAVIGAFAPPLAAAFAALSVGGAPMPYALCMLLSAALLVLLCTALQVLLCEQLPRRLAPPHAEGMAFALVGFMRATLAFFYPLWWLLSRFSNLISRLFGVDPHASQEEVTEEEIRLLVDVGEETGVIEGSQKQMINNIFEFDDITAVDIMTPRTDVEAIDVSDSVDDALAAAVDNGVSRLPIYEEDIDHVVGVLYIKDLLPYVGRPLPEAVTVRSMMRETLFVPETKRCGELFSEMTALHIQMAMVVDEYGGIAGIVTMEDLLESIVGNMQDEYDNEQEEVKKLDENRFEVDGSADIEQVSLLIGIELPEGDYDTLGGFLLERLGRIPEADEHPVISYQNATFTVREMDDRRIELVHIEIAPQADAQVRMDEKDEKKE
ncbi:MAG: hemolysin family protein [Acutalibacteraceae bacterium]